MTPRHRDMLTARELEVVELLCTGLTVKEIAHRLGVSYHTVVAHLAGARRHTDSRTNAQLAARIRVRRPRSAERSFA